MTTNKEKTMVRVLKKDDSGEFQTALNDLVNNGWEMFTESYIYGENYKGISYYSIILSKVVEKE